MNRALLPSITLEEAKEKQFQLVDEITKVFTGDELLSLGDLGVRLGTNQPHRTRKVEEVLSGFFKSEAAILVRGAGTSALRQGIQATTKVGDKILVHSAAIYPTTKTSIETSGLQVISCDFNDNEQIKKTIENNPDLKLALIQYTRQTPRDIYSISEVIKIIKESKKDIKIITDDNYAVMKVPRIGTELGADLSGFSLFKLLGPEGVGCLVGKKNLIDKVREYNYSGGSQVQGYEAMEALRGLVYAPVSLAIQNEANNLVLQRLKTGELPFIDDVYLANAQSKVLIIVFKEKIAVELLREAMKLGALPNPVGAESKYEITPLFYRVSKTYRDTIPGASERMIRINPNRAGSETIIRILQEAYKNLIGV